MQREQKYEDAPERPAQKKASIMQVAATMFWALFMIGKRGTWEKDGATITMAQAIVGAVVTGIVVVLILASLVWFALH